MSDAERPISYQPTDGLTYDPEDPRYWDAAALQAEITRTFEICHGCRLCFKYCDTFPELFAAIDKRHDGDVRKLQADEIDHLFGLCFQCKLCEVQCPYTVRDDHEYQLDFPRLVHRYQAQKTRREGIPWARRLLADPDGAGRMARASFGMANRMNRVGLHRWFMEKLLDVHHDKLLPDFAPRTFEAIAADAGWIRDTPGGEVVLFQTCYVQNNEPEIGRDTMEVLQHNDVDVACVRGLGCCGMPAWETGDLDTVRRRAHHNLGILLPFVEAGARVAAINPTCAMMTRNEYAQLVAPADRPAAQRLAEAVVDPSEYLWGLRNTPRFKTDFKSTPGKVGYHAPCHLRAQGIGFKGRDLIKKIPGASVTSTLECCGHDGTWAMRVEGFEASARIGQKAFDGVRQGGAEVCATDCPLAALQFQQHAGRKGLHPMTILARAYRDGGFPEAIATEPAAADPAPDPQATPEDHA